MSQEDRARMRTSVILRVRSGQITAREGARILGVSRKTYYEWEQRGLEGMMHSLEEKEPGRPARKEDPEKEALEKRIRELEKELRLAEEMAEVRALVLAMERKAKKKQ